MCFVHHFSAQFLQTETLLSPWDAVCVCVCVWEMMLCCLLRWWCVFSWLLYVDPFHRGSCVLLEEGQTVTTSGGPQQDLKETREPGSTDLCVRSVRTLLKVSGAVYLSVSVSVTVYYCDCCVSSEKSAQLYTNKHQWIEIIAYSATFWQILSRIDTQLVTL